MEAALSFTNFILIELLLFSAFWFLVGSLDDLLEDVLWASRKIFRKFRYYTARAPITIGELGRAEETGLLAVFVPAWQEDAVIGQMLTNVQKSWQNSPVDYRIFVGCYPNDMATNAVVADLAAQNRNIVHVTVGHDGPTSKADCLNYLWDAMLAEEQNTGKKVKAIVLHDAEDLVHQNELYLFDRLIEQNPAVQLPVLPLPVPGSPFISSHYCDEFAESHSKGMVLREALGASVPLAGVGCAIDREILGQIADSNGGHPFDPSSLTEDYELGFKIAQYGQTIFVRMRDEDGNLICSRGHFPSDFDAAVRQKARWMIGIALAGWDKLGWRGSLAQKWMLLRDRKAPLAAIILFCAYLCIVLTGILSGAYLLEIYKPAPLPFWVVTLLWVNLSFLLWRLSFRAAFVTRLYGWRQGVMTIPRSFVANIIAIMAARRACMAYAAHIFGAALGWDKTEHRHFPEKYKQ